MLSYFQLNLSMENCKYKNSKLKLSSKARVEFQFHGKVVYKSFSYSYQLSN